MKQRIAAMRVLVAIDNQPSSRATVDALVKMHWYEGTEIALVTVLAQNEEAAGPGEEPSAHYEEMENLAVELRNRLKQCNVPFFARHGDPKTVITDLAEHSGADLVVVGSNCQSTLERLLLGSVSQSIINSAPCPVIVAKTPCFFAQENVPAFQNILFPVDDSIFSEASAHWLGNFRWSMNTNLTLLAVVEMDTDFDQVQLSLDNRARALSRYFNPDKIFTKIVKGQPEQSILDAAKKGHADLIVMGSHGHAGFKKLILGSVSQAVSHAAPCAVAIVRGLAGEDRSLKRTATFEKIKIAPRNDTAMEAGNGGLYNNMSSVHSMPGGF